MREEEIIKIKGDLYKEGFICKNCADFDENHCNWKGILVDDNEKGCILFLNKEA